jgi:glycosyltransferase involved in cell wall biosynthesis
MLEPWSLQQNRAIKRVALALWERRNLQSAALLHATSEAEASQFRKLGFQNPLAVVPNGLDLPEYTPIPKQPPRRALFLSRFHPKKGADLLLQAWAALTEREGWTLDLAGPDEHGYRAQLEIQAKSLGIQGSVTFRDAQYGDDKWTLLRRSSLLILPSHSENFGNVVPEALSQGVPVIATQGTPWADLVTHGCGWWPATSVEGIQEALSLAIRMEPHALVAMGQRGIIWSRSAFTAKVATKQMLRHYEELLTSHRASDD